MPGSALVASRSGPAGVLGGVKFVGRVEGGRGVPGRRARVHDSFAMMYVFGGAGRYRDANHDQALTPGDLVFVFPHHPHWYGVTSIGTWDEVYLVFDGPVFAAAWNTGLLSTDRPVHRLLPVEYWRQRIDAFRIRRPPRSSAARDREACEVLRLMIDIQAYPTADRDDAGADWFSRSQHALEADLAEPVILEQVAAEVGMPYETWRRRFRSRAGMSPSLYRRMHRIEAARVLLTDTSLSVREIAASLGFVDEHHLNRHFRAKTGVSPRAYRERNL